MRAFLLTGWLLVSLLLTGLGALRADDYSGTYVIQGNKGAITLTLQQDDATGIASGSLKGGDLSLQLKGFPREGGGLFGTAANAQGQFVSFFMVSIAGDKLMLDLIEANADGDPDPDKKSRIPFPLTGATKTPPTKAAPPAAEDGDKEGDVKDDGKDDVDKSAATTQTGKGAFAGTFKSPELTLESRAAGNDYTGTIKMGGHAFPFTATEVDGTMHGTFASGNDRFDFQAMLQGSKMTLTTGDTEYSLQKQGAAQNPLAKNPLAKKNPPNPLAKPTPVNPLAKSGAAKTGTTPSKQPAKTGTAATPPKSNSNALPAGGPGQSAAWKIYKHAVGISVRYPPNWTMKESAEAGGVQLIPPDVTTLQGGPTEIYFITGEGAQGVTSVEDPRLVQYVETQIAKLLPTMQRVGEVEKVYSGTQPGIVMTWEGQAPTGQAMRAQVLGTILKGYAVSILSIGLTDKLKAREKTIREIAASFAAGAGDKDPQLVGAWKFWSYKSSADGRYGTETTRYFRLMPDGTCTWSSKGESSGNFSGKDSGGNTTWTGGIAGQSGDSDQGTWSAGNGQLYVIWKDGSTSSWTYKLGGAPGNRRLFLQGSSKNPDEWVETQ